MEYREDINKRILADISEEYDKSEGQFFHDVTSAVSIELERAYRMIDDIALKIDVDKLKGLDLDRRVKESGITRKDAVKSIGYVTITGVEGSPINKGDLVATDSLNFVFLENKTIVGNTAIVKVECEKGGLIGNVPIGAIKYFPKTLQGLQKVTNGVATNGGTDMENDTALRERYYIKVRTPATSGNLYHYKNWCLEVNGVGDAIVLPVWSGAGTVKCIIIDSNKNIATPDLVQNVKNHIELNRPVGADVTVVSAIAKNINIETSLVLLDGADINLVKPNIEQAIKDYFKSIAFKQSFVSYAKIGALIIDTEGVKDYTDLKIDNATNNINIAVDEIALLGGFDIV